jgi:excisionase family DNA binding protein
MDEPYALTIQQAARALAVSTRTIDRMIADGTLPSAKIRGRRLIPTAAVRCLIDDNTTSRREAS